MAWVESHLKGGGGVKLDTVLEDGQVSTTSAYATANFEDISEYDYLFIKVHFDYDGIIKEYTTVFDVSVFDVTSSASVYAVSREIGNVSLKITKTSIQCTGYGGAWRDIYVDIKGTNLEVW